MGYHRYKIDLKYLAFALKKLGTCVYEDIVQRSQYVKQDMKSFALVSAMIGSIPWHDQRLYHCNKEIAHQHIRLYK
jgi:predicted alpha-1,6-mannanase (GH76 family)